jgi:hypothetical protein
MRSIIGQCPECCECPAPIFTSKYAERSEIDSTAYLPCVQFGYGRADISFAGSGAAVCGEAISTHVSVSSIWPEYIEWDRKNGGGAVFGPRIPLGGPYVTWTYSIPTTLADLLGWLEEDLDAVSYRDGGPLRAKYLDAGPRTAASISGFRFKIRHKIPKVGRGKCYKVEWVERFIPELTRDSDGTITGGGTSIATIEVVKGGLGYRTATAFTTLEGGGISNFVGLGEVGNGYASAPTVTISQPDHPSGTQATATATVLFGAVVSITVTSQGSGYLSPPAVSFSAPSGATAPSLIILEPVAGGVTATATATLSPTGQIQLVSVTDAGTLYTFEPLIEIYSPHGLGLHAEFRLHLGTEISREYVWDGAIPGGYDPLDPETYPKSKEYEVLPLEAQGETQIANIVSFCRGCT